MTAIAHRLRWVAELPAAEPVELDQQICFDADGHLVAAGPADTPELLTAVEIDRLLVDGRPASLDWTAVVDCDEVAQEAVADQVVVQLRHTFDRTWQLRGTVRNQAQSGGVAVQLGLRVAAGVDTELMVDAAGATGSIACHRADGTVLGFRLTRGELVVDDGRLVTPPLQVPAGASWSFVLSGEWYADQRQLRQRYPAWLPTDLELARGDALTLELPDAGLVADGLEVDTEDTTRMISHPRDEGIGVLRVHEGSGTSVLSVAWASTLAAQLSRTADVLLTRRVLHTPAEALCLQRAVAEGVASADAAADLLTDFADRRHQEATPLNVLFLTRLAMDGQPEALDRASAAFGRLAPGPGGGLAWINLNALLQLSGRQPEASAQQSLVRLVRWVLGSDAWPTAAAEVLSVVTVRASGAAQALARAERRLRLWQDAPGVGWPIVPAEQRAHALAVAAVRGQPTQRLERRLLAECADHAAGENCPVLAWLAVTPTEV